MPLTEQTDDEIADAPARPWYEGGLHFVCTQCGACCSGARGYVWVEPSEARAMASAFSLTLDEFGLSYLRRVGRRYALLENPLNGDCVFLREGRCLAYSLRPSQCRSFPFWKANLRNPDAWRTAARECEGIAADAPLLPAREIDRLADPCR